MLQYCMLYTAVAEMRTCCLYPIACRVQHNIKLIAFGNCEVVLCRGVSWKASRCICLSQNVRKWESTIPLFTRTKIIDVSLSEQIFGERHTNPQVNTNPHSKQWPLPKGRISLLYTAKCSTYLSSVVTFWQKGSFYFQLTWNII
jgi:hypothetical protein